MGYCIEQTNCEFFISKTNFDEALAAIKKLAETVDADGCGGSYGPGPSVVNKKWYSWVFTENFVNAKTLEEALTAWRWEVKFDEEGNINYIEFAGEKMGQDEIMFKAIAPFVKSGSRIRMKGEDDYSWEWVFENKELAEIEIINS